MQLTKVRLQNFGPYRDSTYELSQGLIGIVGPNGSGKSTLVNGIYACLTNDFSRFDGRKAGIICDTAGERDRSSVEVCGEHQGVPFKLIRNLRPNSAKLVMGDKSYTKAADIEQHLIKNLGMNRRLIDSYVFVNQWDMFSFLSQTDSKRAAVFQSLCGTEKSTDIYDVCTKFLNDKRLATDVVDNRDEIEANLSSLRLDLADLETRRSEYSQYLMKEKNHRGAEKIIRHYTVLMSQYQERKLCREVGESLTKDAKYIRTKLVAVKREAEKLGGFAAKASEAVIEMREGKLLQEQAFKNKRRLDALRLKLKGHEKIKPKLEAPSESVCPTCGQDVHGEKMAEILKTEYRKNLRSYEEVVVGITHEISGIEVNEEHLNFNTEVWENVLSAHTNTDREFKVSQKRVVEFEKSASQIEGEICANNERISSLDSALRGSSLSEYNVIYHRAKDRLAEHTANKTKIDSLDGAASVKKEAIDDNERLLVSLEKRLADRARCMELLEVTSKVRDLFHWQSLPRQVAQANLSAITGEINAALENFGNPFWVEADTNLSFQVHFPGASSRSAGSLSGGQKVVLAICFRSAVNRLFGNSIGMMFLDEPTSGLDDENIGYFKEVLVQMAKKIRDKYQLFVITHEEALSSSFDRTVSVGA